MAGSIAASAFFPGPPAPPAAPKNALGERPDSLDVRGITAAKPSLSSSAVRAARTRAHAAVPKVNGGKSALEHEPAASSSSSSSAAAPRTFYNQLPDWSMLLAAITTIFLAAEKQWTLIDWKPKRPDMLVDTFGFGRIIHDGFMFRQNFSIRSYEIGADRTASIETLMNHLQETALNHVKGAPGDGGCRLPQARKAAPRKKRLVASRTTCYPKVGFVAQSAFALSARYPHRIPHLLSSAAAAAPLGSGPASALPPCSVGRRCPIDLLELVPVSPRQREHQPADVTARHEHARFLPLVPDGAGAISATAAAFAPPASRCAPFATAGLQGVGHSVAAL